MADMFNLTGTSTSLLVLLLGFIGCKEYACDFDAACAHAKRDPSSWEVSVQKAEVVFVGDVVGIEQTCGANPDYLPPVVVLEVTEDFEGVQIGDQISLEWYDDTAGCPPDVMVGEAWVIVARDDSYNVNCAPGGRLADPETEELYEWLSSWYES